MKGYGDQEMCLYDCKRDTAHVFKRVLKKRIKEGQSVTPHSGNVILEVILETISKNYSENKLIGSIDLQKKIMPDSLLALYDTTTGLVDDRRADSVVYLDTSKGFSGSRS